MLWVAKWRRHGDLTAEKNGCTEPRFAGGIAVVLSGLLIVSDIEQGKRFHEKLDRLRKKATAANGEQSGPANGSQPFRSETNRTSSAAGHR